MDASSKAAAYWPASSSLRNTAASYWPAVSSLREAAASYWPGSFSLKKAAGSVEGSDSTSTPVTRPAGEKLKGLQAGISKKDDPLYCSLVFYDTKTTLCIVLFFYETKTTLCIVLFSYKTQTTLCIILFF